MTPRALFDKWSANKECVHCGRQTVLSADVGLYGALSMDREEGPVANYLDPEISCWPCNMMMRDYDKTVVTYAVTTGEMPLHEHREDFVAYQIARVNHNRKRDLRIPKYLGLPHWGSLRSELSVKITAEDLAPLIPAVDELTGQKYCNCARVHCPLRLSFDRRDSALPHILSNLQPLLTCTNRFKSAMPDHDFRLLIAAFREHNKAALIGNEPPKLTPAPTAKQCDAECKKWKPLAQFAHMKISPDGLQYACRTCGAAASSLQRTRSKKAVFSRAQGVRLGPRRGHVPLIKALSARDAPPPLLIPGAHSPP
jgi:hypothetical protein